MLDAVGIEPTTCRLRVNHPITQIPRNSYDSTGIPPYLARTDAHSLRFSKFFDVNGGWAHFGHIWHEYEVATCHFGHT
jgi:hypothetical protein